MGKQLERTAWAEFGRQELERCFAREQAIWPDLVAVSVDEGCGEFLVQTVWKLASATGTVQFFYRPWEAIHCRF